MVTPIDCFELVGNRSILSAFTYILLPAMNLINFASYRALWNDDNFIVSFINIDPLEFSYIYCAFQ